MLQALHFYIFLQSVLLALVCFFAKARSDRHYLGLFFLCFSGQDLHIVFTSDLAWLIDHFYWGAIPKVMRLSAPAFLFLHVKHLANIQLNRYDKLLFAPALIYFVAFIWLYQSGHFTNLESYLSSPFFFIVQSTALIYSVVLLLRWLLIQAKARSGPLYPEQRLIIVWIQWLFVYFIFRDVAAGLFIPIQLYFGLQAVYEWYLWGVVVGLLFMLFMVNYLLLRNPYLFDSLYSDTSYNLEQKLVYSILPTVDKIQIKSKLSDDLINTYRDQIREAMEVHQLYTNTLLTQRGLSQTLNIPVHQLSFVINHCFGKSFNQFVNEYRVEKAKMLLSDPSYQNEKIFAIGIDSGFNSESSFYTVFKKISGFTPSEFRARKFGDHE